MVTNDMMNDDTVHHRLFFYYYYFIIIFGRGLLIFQSCLIKGCLLKYIFYELRTCTQD